MWRFILVTFGFLGWAFYEVSGGAAYSPAQNSLQVAWADNPLFARPATGTVRRAAVETAPDVAEAPVAAPEPVLATVRTDEHETARPAQLVTRGDSAAGLSVDDLGRFTITLASTAQPAEGSGTQPLIQDLDLGGLGGFSAETLVRNVNLVPIDQAVVPAPVAAADIRSISRASANMRNGPGTDFGKLAQLAKGTPVEVLESASNGWMKLRDMDTGQVGWMADWLVTTSN